MPTVNIHKAKTELSRLVEAVESGAEAEIIIARNGKPAARLVPVPKVDVSKRIGAAKWNFDIPPPDPELDAEIAALFYGKGTKKSGRRRR
jgi:prevent-host-death family protein